MTDVKDRLHQLMLRPGFQAMTDQETLLDGVKEIERLRARAERAETVLKVQGIGRMADNTLALLITLNGEPTDNEMRLLYDYLLKWRAP